MKVTCGICGAEVYAYAKVCDVDMCLSCAVEQAPDPMVEIHGDLPTEMLRQAIEEFSYRVADIAASCSDATFRNFLRMLQLEADEGTPASAMFDGVRDLMLETA